jgi:hypothetical protein
MPALAVAQLRRFLPEEVKRAAADLRTGRK